jgi:hypothetical protein
LIGILLISVLAIVAIRLLWVVTKRYDPQNKLAEKRIDQLNLLIQKFGTAKEFLDFLQTEEGKKLFENPIPVKNDARKRVLQFIIAGCISVFIGIGLSYAGIRSGMALSNDGFKQAVEFGFWSSIFWYLGFGFLIVAGVLYLAGKKWHLLNNDSSGNS